MTDRTNLPNDPFKALIDAGAGDAWRQTMLHQFERFWEGQRKLLDEYQSFSRALLDRRRVATDATLETVRKLGTATDGADWAKCYSEWLSGSFARMAEDGRDFIEEGMKVMGEVSQTMSAGIAETAQATAEAQKSAARDTAAAQSAAAEQGSAMAQEAARAAKSPLRPRRPEEGMRPGAAE